MSPAHRALAALVGLAVGLGIALWRPGSPPDMSLVAVTPDGGAATDAHAALAPSEPIAPGDRPTAHSGPKVPVSEGALPDGLRRALSEQNPLKRGEAIVSALRMWGAVDVQAAGTWAVSQTLIDPTRAVAAVLNGAVPVGRIEEAEQLVSHLARIDATQTHDYGAALIHALGDGGHHQRASAIAAGGSDRSVTAWLALSYSAWARRDPEAAMVASATLADVTRRRAAFQAATSTWARTDPTRLAECALNFPTGPERDFALVAALRTWSARAPMETAAWMRTHRDLLAQVNRWHVVLED